VADVVPPPPLRRLGEQAFSRAAGAPLVPGNAVRLLKDAAGNYPVWLDAIARARRTIFFESYILGDDAIGNQFAAALAERARAGVKVRLVRDWIGTFRSASRGYWRRLVEAGVEIRTFNPPRWDRPLGWLTRDHRKSLAIDGEVAFVGGLCVSQRWLGDPARGVPPWRDTAVELRGPSVAHVERAFAQIWQAIGSPIPDTDLTRFDAHARAGDVPLRVIADAPSMAQMFRLDQLIAHAARKTLWLTDAYFVGVAPFVEALRAAARDGVDVRLLLPNASDLPVLQPLSRSGYRTLLEAGVRVYEWNGSMLHAKTAVADGTWARVGSSNLNWASFVANYELDVEIEDAAFAREMEESYLEDLDGSTEIMLTGRYRQRVRPTPGSVEHARRLRRRLGGSSSPLAAGALRAANAVGAAVGRRRQLGPGDRRLAAAVAALLFGLATIALLWPRAIAWSFAFVCVWLALAITLRTLRGGERRERARRERQVLSERGAGPAPGATPKQT
jgi:cardiolipin synthase